MPVLKAVDALGDRPKMLREAVDLLLARLEAQGTVWLLFENEPGHPGRILGVFSSPALAMEAPRVQEVIGSGTWEQRASDYWVCQPAAGEELYFSVEG